MNPLFGIHDVPVGVHHVLPGRRVRPAVLVPSVPVRAKNKLNVLAQAAFAQNPFDPMLNLIYFTVGFCAVDVSAGCRYFAALFIEPSHLYRLIVCRMVPERLLDGVSNSSPRAMIEIAHCICRVS